MGENQNRRRVAAVLNVPPVKYRMILVFLWFLDVLTNGRRKRKEMIQGMIDYMKTCQRIN
jgi:hypothetical protein